MMLPAGVVQSIDANTVDLDNAWIFADADIWSQDYGEVLLQPISIEAVDINDLRFKSSEVVVEIRATPDPTSLVLWSGWCETVDDPSGSTPDLDTRISCGVLDPVPPVFVDNGNGTGTLPIYRRAYGQLDAGVSVDVSKNFSISLDAVNLLKQRKESYQDIASHPRFYQQEDRRIGLRLRFRN